MYKFNMRCDPVDLCMLSCAVYSQKQKQKNFSEYTLWGRDCLQCCVWALFILCFSLSRIQVCSLSTRALINHYCFKIGGHACAGPQTTVWTEKSSDGTDVTETDGELTAGWIDARRWAQWHRPALGPPPQWYKHSPLFSIRPLYCSGSTDFRPCLMVTSFHHTQFGVIRTDVTSSSQHTVLT